MPSWARDRTKLGTKMFVIDFNFYSSLMCLNCVTKRTFALISSQYE